MRCKMKSKKGLIILIAVLAVVFLIAGFTVGNYNSFVSAEAEVEEKQAVISTQLQRRSDLIPNLVNTVKGYAAHEENVYSDIAEARSKLAGAGTVEEMSSANNELSSALNRLMVVVENYPTLKANENFVALQDELAGTENRIATARNDYNKIAKEYNTKIKRFPGNLFAGMFGFEAVEYFEAEPDTAAAPEVSFE